MAAFLNKPVVNLLLPCSKSTTPLYLFISRRDAVHRSFSLYIDNLPSCALIANTGIGIALYGG